MKAKALLYAAVVAAVSLSCTREAEESGLLNSGKELEFTAEWAETKSTSGYGAYSRTALQEDGTSIWWTPNEEINVFFGTGASGRFVSTNTDPKPVVSFYGTLNTIIGGMETEGNKPIYWAVYPYSASNSCDGQSVTLTVPYNQSGTKGTFADKFFPAVACGDSYSLAFYNVSGGARFSVTQEGVTKVIFKSNDGSPMAGKVKVGFGEDDKPQILEITEPVDSVVVNAPEGGFIPGENYFAAMLPQMHAEGLTVILKQKGKKAEKTLQSNIEIKRSTFGTLNNIDEGLEYVKDESEPEVNPDDAIQFEDPIAKYACVDKFDINGDGEVSYAEAAAATSLSGLFTDWNTVTHFDEIRFFTSVSSTQNVFTGLKNLKHITIPDNITTLGTFQNCAALDTVALPAALKALPAYCFDGCTALKSVTLPEGISAIPNYAFQNCSSLETVAIPSTITTIGQNAFTGCTILAGIDLPYGFKTIGDFAFQNCQAIVFQAFPSSLTSIGRYAFSGCTSLTTFVLPEDMTSIPDGCFQNCTVLANITWPGALSDIGAYAFYGCVVSKDDPLASAMELPSTVKTIGSQAFIGVKHLIMPSTSAISIAADAFAFGFTWLYVPDEMVEMCKVRTNWSAYKDQIYPISDFPASGFTVPNAVDLGLSVKWASFNLGGSKPEDYGDYFAWGETEPYYYQRSPLIWKNGESFGYSWPSYRWCKGSCSTLTKYCFSSSYGYDGFTDNKTVLNPEDDAAAVALGGSWRMATYDEWDELKTKCTWTWTTQNGVNGMLVTGPNGNSIFLPAAGHWRDTRLDAGSFGYYWSSSISRSYYTYCAAGVYFYSSMVDIDIYSDRCCGHLVRPVYPLVKGVALNESSLQISKWARTQLIATITPENASNKTVVWSSSDESIATVSENGVVTGIEVGTAVITAITVDGGFTAECEVQVNYSVKEPKAIDLGLSIKWASFNLGATKPKGYGFHFAWGETEPKEDYTWVNYLFRTSGDSSYNVKFSKYNNAKRSDGPIDNKTVLDPEDDAAAVALGGSWRMPTCDEQDELRNNCTWTWTTQNGVNGMLVTGPNGNSIFLPAAGRANLDGAGAEGFYLSSSLYAGDPYCAFSVYIASRYVHRSNIDRCSGGSVRPVSE